MKMIKIHSKECDSKTIKIYLEKNKLLKLIFKIVNK